MGSRRCADHALDAGRSSPNTFRRSARAPAGPGSSGRAPSGVGNRARPDRRRPPAGALLVGLGVPDQRAGRRRRASACAIPLVPDSKNPAALAPGRTRAARCCRSAGLGLLLWAIIEAPVHGWSSDAGDRGSAPHWACSARGFRRLGNGLPGRRPCSTCASSRNRSVLGRRSSSDVAGHVRAVRGPVRARPSTSSSCSATRHCRPGCGCSPPPRRVALVAPVSAVSVRLIGAKFTTAIGLLIVTAALWQISGVSVTSTYADSVAGPGHAGHRRGPDHPVHHRRGHGLGAPR